MLKHNLSEKLGGESSNSWTAWRRFLGTAQVSYDKKDWKMGKNRLNRKEGIPTATLYTVILVGHVACAITGFLGASGLVVAAYRQRKTGELTPRFWQYQAYVQIITVLLGVFGTALFLMGGRPKVILHILYGALALLTVVVERGMGRGRQLREVLAQDYGHGHFNEAWWFFGLNLFLWAMYGRGLTTGFFGF